MKKFLVFVLVFMMAIPAMTEEELFRHLSVKTQANIREDCNINSRVIGKLQEGDEIYGIEFLMGEDGKNWVLAETTYGKGYICEEDLQYVAESIQPKEIHIWSVSDETPIYASCSTKSEIISTVEAWEELTASLFYPSDEGTWCQVCAEGKVGFVLGKFFQLPNGKRVANLPDFLYASKDSKVYEEASLSSEPIDFVFMGDKVNVQYYLVLSNDSIMVRGETSNGYVGFIMASDLVAD